MSTASPSSNPYATPTAVSEMQLLPTAGAELATRGERFLGALIDVLLMMVVVIPLSFAVGAAIVFSGMDAESWAASTLGSLAGGLGSALTFIAINGYLLADRGQTVGKVVMKTMIVSDATDQKLPLGKLLGLRYLPLWVLSALPGVGGLISLVNALMIFRSNRKCLHDDLAGTKVIKLQ